MRVNKIVCDGCGKEILGNPIKVLAEKVDRESGDFADLESVYDPKKDFCKECFGRIKDFIETMGEKEVLVMKMKPTTEKEISDLKEAIKNAPLTILQEEPTVEAVSAPAEPEQPKATKAPSVKELVLQGLSKEEVCRITGCTPITYNQTKYQLRKKGLLPKAEDDKEPVKCSEVQKSCIYHTKAGSEDICDFIGKTGNMRTCPAEACTAYERKGKR